MKATTPIAIKVITGQENAETNVVAFAAFMEEAAVGWQFEHENVVRTYGVVTSGSPFLLVLELCERGVLQEYVRTANRDVGELVCILRDVAVGMAYVHTMGVVHRDLAARNVLLDKAGVPKIADFGLGRKMKGGVEYYRASNTTTHLPLRWTDPWSILHQIFTFGTDVWSFGILAIELFTRGARPYNHWPSNLVVLEHVREGYRLPCPPTMPRVVHDRVVLPSWSSSASTDGVRISMAGNTSSVSRTATTAAAYLSARPSFANLVERMDEIIADSDGANYNPGQSRTGIDTGNDEPGPVPSKSSMYYGVTNKANSSIFEYAPTTTTKAIEVGEFNLGDGVLVVSSDAMRRVNGLPLVNADTTSVSDADETGLIEKTDRASSASIDVTSHPRRRRSSKFVFYEL
jgi:serine/threonine protein kinase